MKLKKTIITLPFIALLLSGCIGKKEYASEKYILETSWGEKDEFRILQLGDIHQSQSDIHEEHFKLIDKTINKSKPDFIVLNGDIFTYADKHVVKKVFSYFDEKGIPWTFTYGNHDDQGYYSDTYIQRLLGGDTYKNVKFVNLEDDNVTGRSNFVINIKSGDSVKYQIYCLDSHSYNFDTGEYDFIKQDQIDWYERMVKYSKEHYGNDIKSSMYLHIAFPEFVKDWETRDDFIIGTMEEGGGSPSEDLGFYNKIKELGSTISIHANHDHANDGVFKYEDVYFAFGVHSTNRIYNDKEGRMLGGQILRVNRDDPTELIFENYYASYDSNEVIVKTTKGDQ